MCAWQVEAEPFNAGRSRVLRSSPRQRRLTGTQDPWGQEVRLTAMAGSTSFPLQSFPASCIIGPGWVSVETHSFGQGTSSTAELLAGGQPTLCGPEARRAVRQG